MSTQISYFDQPGPGKGFLYSGRILWDGKKTFRIVSGTDVERSDYRPEDLIRDHKAGRISRSTVNSGEYALLVPSN